MFRYQPHSPVAMRTCVVASTTRVRKVGSTSVGPMGGSRRWILEWNTCRKCDTAAVDCCMLSQTVCTQNMIDIDFLAWNYMFLVFQDPIWSLAALDTNQVKAVLSTKKWWVASEVPSLKQSETYSADRATIRRFGSARIKRRVCWLCLTSKCCFQTPKWFDPNYMLGHINRIITGSNGIQ